MPTNSKSVGKQEEKTIPIGTRALILSKFYYGVLSKSLENLDVERYYSILYFLYDNNGCCQQHICNNLAIDKTAMVKVIDYLIKLGYIARKVNPKDRREHFVLLTRKGAKHTAKIVDSFKKIDEVIFSGVPQPDRDIFEKVLCRLTSNLKELPANDLKFNFANSKSDEGVVKPHLLIQRKKISQEGIKN